MRQRLVAGLFIAAAVIGACVIAEPPADLPAVASTGPRIVRASTFPPASAVFTNWPEKFIVPVQLSDPRIQFVVTKFVDYNAGTGDGYNGFDLSTPAPTNQNANPRFIEVTITQPTSEGCHVIEVIVASNITTENARSAHSPGDGDSVSWIYSSNGDPSGCPITDAGLTPIIDAGDDAGDGGDGGAN